MDRHPRDPGAQHAAAQCSALSLISSPADSIDVEEALAIFCHPHGLNFTKAAGL